MMMEAGTSPWTPDGKTSMIQTSIPFATEPVTYSAPATGSSICSAWLSSSKLPEFAGAPQCCSQDSLTKIASNFGAAKVHLEAAEAKVSANTFFEDKGILETTTQEMFALIQDESCSGSCSTDMSTAQTNLDTTVGAFSRGIDAVKTAMKTCSNSLQVYARGMLCSSCLSPQEYSQVLVNETVPSIMLANSTCQQVTAGCMGVQESIVSFNATAHSLYDQLMQLPTISNFCKENPGVGFCSLPLSIATIPDFCGGTLQNNGNCTYDMCYRMIDSIGYPNPRWPEERLSQPQPHVAYAFDGSGYDAYSVGCEDYNETNCVINVVPTPSPTPAPSPGSSGGSNSAVTAVVVIIVIVVLLACGGGLYVYKFGWPFSSGRVPLPTEAPSQAPERPYGLGTLEDADKARNQGLLDNQIKS
jgi:hypothetical protein